MLTLKMNNIIFIQLLALWNNDGAGQTRFENAKKEFGNFESKNFYLFPVLI